MKLEKEIDKLENLIKYIKTVLQDKQDELFCLKAEQHQQEQNNGHI
jgi:hypothetical protein